jgi:DDE family transposase
MEHQLWKQIVTALRPLCQRTFCPRESYPVLEVLAVWFWAVVHDRPVSWAVQARHWPPHLRRPLPSGSTLSRRLRSAVVRDVLRRCELALLRAPGAGGTCLVWKVDGKPLVIGSASKDPHAGFGRAVGGLAKGYKLHLILGADGSVPDWRVAPMNQDERVLAERMLSQADLQGYVLADGNYDTTTLHRLCDSLGSLQLVSPRRKKYRGKKPSRRHRAPGRLRSIELLEGPGTFGRDLLRQRDQIERYYGRLSGCAAGLTHLPPWVRTQPRVHRWVQAKLLLLSLRPLAA